MDLSIRWPERREPRDASLAQQVVRPSLGGVCRARTPVAQKIVATRKKQQLSIGPCKSLPNSPSHSSVCSAQVSAVHVSQTSNGGGSLSDYSSSVPSTPSTSQKELRMDVPPAAGTPTPARKQSKRRSNLFAVSVARARGAALFAWPPGGSWVCGLDTGCSRLREPGEGRAARSGPGAGECVAAPARVPVLGLPSWLARAPAGADE
ncbi:Arf-GAP with GTPase, ANK repeat and PH domain-containing protein 1 [Galemys pyrenaicus]|uniref:Arf-GAP with GTPase, ANK repeat and PH domain-containing protein 1 n=1 Tax=Galemys pyrenaicus TaxID=202257 RepID=A0A8J6DN37_GALPY|nr:Arf-GAP with GTPase, ANK repeat and PH domain-containing protein 1 [Galemys pyrenaicus]